MLDPAAISQEHLGTLAGMYAHGQFLYGADIFCSPKKQRKFRRLLTKQYSDSISQYPAALSACFAPEVSDREVLDFLSACNDQMQAVIDQQKRQRDEILAPLGPETAAAVKAAVDRDYWPQLQRQGDACTIIVDECPAFRRSLLLKDVAGNEETSWGYFMDIPKIQRELERYRISGELDETEEPLSLTFSDAQVQVECFNCVEGTAYWDDPWAYLRALADQIILKAEVPGAFCNDQERALLPLLRELNLLDNLWDQDISVPLLKAMAAGFGYDKITKKLADLESAPKRERHNRLNRLGAMLCRQEYEPMWREIFEKIKASQVAYPIRTDRCRDVGKMRAAVQHVMERQGFSGTYPDFEKRGEVSGIHLEESYDQTYFIGMEKHAVFYIHCVESCTEEDQPVIQFLCGTAFPRKNGECGDIYTCLFNAGGHRLFRWVRDHAALLYDPEARTTPQDVARMAAIAVKKVQLQKLTKEEKKRYHNGAAPGLGLFWWILIAAGGFFGIFMTLGMMLVTVVVLTLFGEFREIPQFMSDVPWGYCLLFSWLGFGGMMGIITVLAKRK